MPDTPDFNAIVRDYERLTEPMTVVVAREALALAPVAPGERVIDVAAGPGTLAVAAAAQGASVLATDVAPMMVTRAAERLQPYPDCEARVMDLAALDVADAAFDAAFSTFGTMMFAGWQQGLREMMRVVRPGGRVVVTAWLQGEDDGPAMLIRRVFAETFPGRELWPEDFFPMWSRDSFTQALRLAGCIDVGVQVCRTSWRVAAVAGVMDVSAPMLRLFPGFAALSPAERDRLRTPVETAVAAHQTADGSVEMPTFAYVGIGRKPA